MPRRHKPTVKRQLPAGNTSESSKKRYASKSAALAAAREQQKYELFHTLRVYQSPHDGYWYLTSSSKSF